MKSKFIITCLTALVCAAGVYARNVARIGTDEYATITEALAQWDDGETLILLTDVEINNEITIENKSVILDLNGYGITQTAATCLFNLRLDGNLTLQDSQPVRSERHFRVDAIDKVAILDAGGKFSFTGGYLYGGHGKDGGFEDPNRGGAVNINRGSFTMSGGTILGNRAQFGGAVAVEDGSFTMHGGTICYNANTRHTADDQGGSAVWVQSDNAARMEMDGTASIAHNYSFRNNAMGAQVVVFGVDETPYYPFVLRGGTPVINESGNGVNLALADGNVIRVAGKLNVGAQIGVTASDAPRTFTSNYSFQNYDELPSTYFFSDDNSYVVNLTASNKEAELLAYISENDDEIVAKIERWVGKMMSLKMHRTLSKDGTYYTLCLPFSLASLTDTPLEGGSLFEFYSTTIDVNPSTGTQTLHLIIKPATSIEAGKPYLIRWAKTGESLSELLFTDVFVETAESRTVTDTNGAEFIGHMAKEHIDDDPAHSKLFVGANNTLFWPVVDDATTMKGFRAYFSMPNGVVINDNVVIPGMLATFTIGFGAEEDIEKVPDNQLPGTKIIENGVLYLLYQGTKYDVQGNRVR